MFGTGRGSVGVLAPSDGVTGNSAGDLYLAWLRNRGTTNEKWIAVRFAGPFAHTPTTTGRRYSDLVYYPRQGPDPATTASAPSATTYATVLRTKGRWGLYTESDDTDDGAIFVHRSATAITWKDKTKVFDGNTVATTGDSEIPELPSEMKVVEGNAHTAAGMDAAFGADDGSMGFYYSGATTNNRIYVKVNGYWFYIAPTSLG